MLLDIDILRAIDRLERSQARPTRELAIDPANEAARARLNQIEAQIHELRESLSRRRRAAEADEG